MDLGIRRAGDLHGDAHTKMIVMGESGAGKTAFCASAPNPLIVLVEPQGMDTVLDHNPEADVLEVLKVAREAGVHPMQVVRNAIQAARKGDLDNLTICFDSLTELSRLFKDEIMVGRHETAEFTTDDWITYTSRFRRFLRALRSLPYDVICVAHVQLDEDESTGKKVMHRFPLFEGRKFGRECAGYFNAAGYAYRRQIEEEGAPLETRYLVMFDGPSRYQVKRCGGLGPIEQPDATDLLGRIKAHRIARATGAAPADVDPREESVEEEPAEAPPAAGKRSRRGGAKAAGRAAPAKETVADDGSAADRADDAPPDDVRPPRRKSKPSWADRSR